MTTNHDALREALEEVLDAYNNKEAALVFDWDEWAVKAEKAIAASSPEHGEFGKAMDRITNTTRGNG